MEAQTAGQVGALRSGLAECVHLSAGKLSPRKGATHLRPLVLGLSGLTQPQEGRADATNVSRRVPGTKRNCL